MVTQEDFVLFNPFFTFQNFISCFFAVRRLDKAKFKLIFLVRDSKIKQILPKSTSLPSFLVNFSNKMIAIFFNKIIYKLKLYCSRNTKCNLKLSDSPKERHRKFTTGFNPIWLWHFFSQLFQLLKFIFICARRRREHRLGIATWTY